MEALLGLVRHSGNEALFRAVEMSILSTLAGMPLHIHAEGLRGTGKTTILRAARRVLPRIRRIAGCLYNCDPEAPHCPLHRHLSREQVEALGSEWVPMPFLEISHSAKIGTVVGSIDLARLVSPTDPAAALLPGTLPQAHRGIVFVDEINRLAETSPELADVLLDVMGTRPGRVQIEETGLPAVELPVTISVWAASNPDEDPGPLEEIRRQLSDRFDFVVPTSRPGEAAVVAEILARFDGGTGGPAGGGPADVARLEAFRAELAAKVAQLGRVEVPAWLRREVAEVYARFGLESLRSVQAMLSGMKLAAVLAGRTVATWEDLCTVAPLALHHRVDGETLGRVLAHLRGLGNRAEARPGAGPGQAAGGQAGGSPYGGLVGGMAAPTAAQGPAAAGGPAPGAARSATPPAGGGRAQPAPGTWYDRLRAILGGRPTAGEGGRGAGSGGAPSPATPAAAAGEPGSAPASGRPADPTQTPPAAPLFPARPIGTLAPGELVATEQDLRRAAGGQSRWVCPGKLPGGRGAEP